MRNVKNVDPQITLVSSTELPQSHTRPYGVTMIVERNAVNGPFEMTLNCQKAIVK